MLKNIDNQAVNYVVAPQLLENQRTKRQKTDRLDARSLLGNLESYLRGNRDAMSISSGWWLTECDHARSRYAAVPRRQETLGTLAAKTMEKPC